MNVPPSNLTFCVCGTKLVDVQEVEAKRVIHSGGVYSGTTKENVAVMKANITIVAENISYFTKGKIPTKLKDGKGNPITTEGTYVFLNNRMFMLNMTNEEFGDLICIKSK